MVETLKPRRTSSGTSRTTKVVLPAPLQPASPITRIAGASHMLEAGLQIVVAGHESEGRGGPEPDLPDQADRPTRRAPISEDEEAQGQHLKERLPLGELADRHADVEPGQIFPQARDQDLAAEDDEGRQDGPAGEAL